MQNSILISMNMGGHQRPWTNDRKTRDGGGVTTGTYHKASLTKEINTSSHTGLSIPGDNVPGLSTTEEKRSVLASESYGNGGQWMNALVIKTTCSYRTLHYLFSLGQELEQTQSWTHCLCGTSQNQMAPSLSLNVKGLGVKVSYRTLMQKQQKQFHLCYWKIERIMIWIHCNK